MNGRRASVLVAILVGGGCAFTDIGEGLEQQTCAGEAAGFCDDLNQLRPTGDECMRWSCDRSLERPVCAVLPRDADDDGSPAAECAPAGVAPDCDDGEARRAPALAESCDGLDNDCDESVDEGSYAASAPAQLVKLESRAQNLRFAPAANGGGAVLASVLGGADNRSPRAAFVADLAPAAPVNDLPLVVLADGGMEFASVRAASAGLWFDADGDALGLLGEVSGGAAMAGRLFSGSLARAATRAELTTTTAHFTDGFADSSPVGYVAVGHNAARTAAVVAFLGVAPSASHTCGSGNFPVVAAAMTSAPDLQPGAASIALGNAADPSAPAVVSLGASQFLVAFADADTTANDIVIFLVTRSGTAVTAASELYREATAAAPGEVALALGAGRVALVFRDGCAAAANVRARILDFDASAPSLKMLGDGGDSAVLLAAGGSADREPRRPTALWHAEPAPGWWFAWERGRATLELALADAQGAAIGDAMEVAFTDSTPAGISLVGTGTDSMNVTAVAYTEDVGADRFGVWAAPFVCTP